MVARRPDIIDMVGQRFGRLIVRELAPRPRPKLDHGASWICECDCGQLTIARRSHLLDRTKRSCRCLKREASRENVKRAISAAYRPDPVRILPEMTREQRLLYEKLRYKQARLPRAVALREALR